MQTPFANSLARPWRRGLSPACLGYAVLRLALGMSMLIHGAGRLPKIGAFTDATVKMFAGSPLPTFAVVAFARMTPPVEALVGSLVLLGLALNVTGLCASCASPICLSDGGIAKHHYASTSLRAIYYPRRFA